MEKLSVLNRELQANYIHYVDLSNQYFENASKFASNKRYEKASEMLWGASALIIKAAATLQNRNITNHAELGKFAKEFAKYNKIPEIIRLLPKIHTMHTKFYGEGMFLNEIAIKDSIQDARAFITLFKRTFPRI